MKEFPELCWIYVKSLIRTEKKVRNSTDTELPFAAVRRRRRRLEAEIRAEWKLFPRLRFPRGETTLPRLHCPSYLIGYFLFSCSLAEESVQELRFVFYFCPSFIVYVIESDNWVRSCNGRFSSIFSERVAWSTDLPLTPSSGQRCNHADHQPVVTLLIKGGSQWNETCFCLCSCHKLSTWPMQPKTVACL